ncbi:unnamed protein product [Brachionus calyciflorus]|uniref:Uncharacterized protein n=1 Tax=Brachionus calyciflorus TaxID=104777 RepID=A0A814N420_9BILA|nr:unnamed protein product [Brachionus calyciflorus]
MVEDFKYLGSYIRSSEKDIEMRIGLTWTAFENIKHVLTSSKINLKLRMRIFNSACIPVLLYGFESWTLTETSSDTLNYLVRTLYLIICGIKQSKTHMTNEELYKIVKQRLITEELRKRELKCIGQSFRMHLKEPANIYSLYQSKVRELNKIGIPSTQYIERITKFLTNDIKVKLTSVEISKYSIDKESWSKLITEPSSAHDFTIFYVKFGKIRESNHHCMSFKSSKISKLKKIKQIKLDDYYLCF